VLGSTCLCFYEALAESDDGQADELPSTVVVDHVALQFTIRGLLGLSEAQVEHIGLRVIVNPHLAREE